MEKIKKLKDKYLKSVKDWNFIVILSIAILLFGYNEYINIALMVIIGLVVSRLNIEKSLLSYIYLYFFEEVLCLNNLYGLTIIIVYPIIAIKLIYNIIKNKYTAYDKETIIFILFAFITAISLITNTISKATLVIDMNVTILLMFSTIIRNSYSKDEIKKLLEKIFLVIIFATINSIIYGLIHNGFMYEKRDQKITIRFKGAYEPNYTAVYLNIAIVSIIYLWNKFKPKISALILALFLIALIFTKSTTGLICFIIILMLLVFKNFTYIKQKAKEILNGKNKKVIISIFIIALLLLVMIEIHYRIFTDKLLIVFNKIKSGDLNAATSGRLLIAQSFMEDLKKEGIVNKIFGNGPQSFKVYSNYFHGFKYAHNIYIDLIYSFGIIGSIIAITYIFIKTKKSVFLGTEITDKKYKDLLLFSKLVLLISGLALSLHCEIIFLVFYLL